MPIVNDKTGYVKFGLDFDSLKLAAEGIGVISGCGCSASGSDTNVAYASGIVRTGTGRFAITGSSINLVSYQHATYYKKIVVYVQSTTGTVMAVAGSVEQKVPADLSGRYTRKPVPADFTGSYALAAGDVVLAEVWLRPSGQYILAADVTDRRSGVQETGIGPTSYVVWKEGSTYFAKNGITGEVEWSGIDALTVIQSAVNALTSGGKIFFKSGTYTLTGPIVLSVGNILLEGEGPASILYNTGTGNTIEHTAASILWHIRIKNLKISSSGTGADAVHLKWCHFTRVEDCYVSAHINGIYIDECFYCIIGPNHIDTMSGSGVLLTNHANANQIIGGSIQTCAIGVNVLVGAATVSIRDVSIESSALGLQLIGGICCLVEGCYFEVCSTGCILVDATPDYTYYSEIKNCFIEQSSVAGYGIKFMHTWACSITRCKFYMAGGSPVIFTADSLHTTFDNPEGVSYTGGLGLEVMETAQYDQANYAQHHKHRMRVQECLMSGDGSSAYYGTSGSYSYFQGPGAVYLEMTNFVATMVGRLKFDSSSSQLVIREKADAGPPTDAVYGNAIGTLVFNSNESKFYIKATAATDDWHSVTVS
jgi:hypothetical protein